MSHKHSPDALPGPEVLSLSDPESFQRAITRAAELLTEGRLVAVPSETVYGLAANALRPEAVSGIFRAKGRPGHNPVIVHVCDLPMAASLVASWPGSATRLAEVFWPGPLTLVLPRSGVVPEIVTAGGSTVGIRWPAHPFFRELIRFCAFPLAAPSANLSNQISPTTAQHVVEGLGARVSAVVDGGSCNVGIESTVLDLSGAMPRILRPGMISRTDIEKVLRQPVHLGPDSCTSVSNVDAVLKSPGLLDKHYSPLAKLHVASWQDTGELQQFCRIRSIQPESLRVIVHNTPPSGFPNVSVIPLDPEAYARALYAEWHQCDRDGMRWIIVEDVPHSVEWEGIRDRLRRAST